MRKSADCRFPRGSPDAVRRPSVLVAGASAITALLAATLVTAAASAQEIDERIRMRVEQLHATGELDAAGDAISARGLIPAIYEARGFEPNWRSAAQVGSLLEVIEDVALEGLDPGDYHVEAVREARDAFADLDRLAPGERAGYDIVLTDSLVRLGYHLRFGKVDPVMLDPHWNLSRDLMGRDPVELVQAAIDAPSLRSFAEQLIPRSSPYQRLKDALARYRAIEAAGGWPSVAEGPTLRPGMDDTRVPALAARLVATGDFDAGQQTAPGTTLYADELVAALRRFQRRHGLAQDGIVGPATRAALNVPVAERIEQLRINLERSRWVFYEPERDFIMVNIAAFRLDLVRRGNVVWSTRVQVGQPYRRTPVFRSDMRYLVMNPTWTVPPGILRQDILPAVRRDPAYLAGRNIDVIDSDGAVLEPAAVDWSRRSFPYRFVQRPGPNNALGRIKFMFPNEHFVYLHDTPSRDLFDREARAFSSGCIRVENPLELALMLLGPQWERQRLDALLATGRTETVFLPQPITVMLLYLTTEVDEDGRVAFLPDIYQRDAAVAAALHEPFASGAPL